MGSAGHSFIVFRVARMGRLLVGVCGGNRGRGYLQDIRNRVISGRGWGCLQDSGG